MSPPKLLVHIADLHTTPASDGVPGGKTGGGSHVADRGSNTEREEGVQGDWVGGVHLEGRDGDPTSPAHVRDPVPRCAARIPGGSRYWDGHP